MQETVVNNRYSIVHTLGGGGMAKVYLAHDEVLDRDVALKALREQFAADEEFVERFKREAQSAAALSHPNIVQIYDRGETEDGSSYIAMEYVPGGTLKERISSGGPLDPGVAASLALQIAEALSAAHERDVVHRDVKPHNVLLTATKDAKVADFGIARAASAATISQTNVVLGTASYMSPEHALGEPATPKSDHYSLGVVLYEMLTGGLPYTAESPVAVSMKHVNEPLRPPKEVNPKIPEGMNAVVVKLLAKNPEERYADAAELAVDLRRVRDGLPPIAAGFVANDTETTRVTAQTTVPVASVAAPERGRGRIPWILAATLTLVALLGALGWALSQGFWQQDSALGEANRPAGVEVPDVEGLTEEQARQKLTDSGFEVDVRPRESSTANTDKVLEQSPAAGERTKKGSRVVIGVGDGPPTVEVPDVVGLSLSNAKVALGKGGLTVGFQREMPSNTAPEDVVVEQGHLAGEKVEPGTAVNLGVSSGPQQVVAPAAAPVSAPVSAPTTAPASASALGGDVDGGKGIDDDNSGPGSSGSGNSGPGGSGGD
jgi:tRNA A-37 threonylcarbamoyl transferase component Bud32